MPNSTITQRIALDGATDVLAQLAALGKAGEAAISQIQAASQRSTGLSALSTTVQKLQGGFADFKTALTPVGQAFQNLGQQAGDFKDSVTQLAGNVIPNFRLVAAAATAGAVAGFIELAKSSAEAANEIANGAQSLGLSVTDYQALGYAADKAGVDARNFAQNWFQFTAQVQKGAEAQEKAVADFATEFYGATQLATAGVQVLYGQSADAAKNAAAAAQGAYSIVLKGGQGAVGQLTTVAQAAGTKVSAVAQLVAATVQKFAPEVSLGQIQADLDRLATDTSADAAKMRTELNSAFGPLFPALTLGEALANTGDEFKQLLQQYVSLVKVGADGNVTIKTTQEAFNDLAQVIGSTTDKQKQLAIVANLFGYYAGGMLPILKNWRNDLADFEQVMVGTNTALTVQDTVVGKQLVASYNLMKTAIGNVKSVIVLAFGPSIVELMDAVRDAVTGNATAIRQWATQLATEAKPAITDFIALLKGASADQIKTPWVKGLIDDFEGLRTAVTEVGDAFSEVDKLFGGAAAGINSIFGTSLTARQLEEITLLGTMTGAFSTLFSAVTLGIAVIGAFWAALTVPAAALGFIASLAGWPITIGLVVTAIAGLVYAFRTPLAEAALYAWNDVLVPFGEWLEDGFVGFWNAAVGAVENVWAGLINYIGTGIGQIQDWVGQIQDWVANIGAALSNVLSAGGGAWPGQTSAGYAGGGLVRGPGSGTSDSILARLSSGEYVNRAYSVSVLGRSFFDAVNAFPHSFAGLFDQLSPAPLRFATGGLVDVAAAAPAGRSSFTLVLDGQSFPAAADEGVAQSLLRVARRRALASGGRKQSWYL
jgi:hypothetical protein